MLTLKQTHVYQTVIVWKYMTSRIVFNVAINIFLIHDNTLCKVAHKVAKDVDR